LSIARNRIIPTSLVFQSPRSRLIEVEQDLEGGL
jgi:hypothetical protein